MRFRDQSLTRVFSLPALQHRRRQRDAERDDTLIEDEPPTLREIPPDLAETTERAVNPERHPRRR